MGPGIYCGSAGQLILVEWDEGPGFNTGCYMYTIDGDSWYEYDNKILSLMEGFDYLGEL